MIQSAKDTIFTVDDVTNKIREAIFASPELQNVSVRGELLGFKHHTSGHAYFTVLGKESRIACVMFRSYATTMLTWPKDGDEVLIRGKLDIYGARGSYQIYATALLPLGAGAKARAKEMLKEQLTKEGLFDPRHKRPIPRFPAKAAIITSPTGAALQDILKISSVRYPATQLVVIPSLMQGASASQEIAAAFAQCADIAGLDFVILARGGGSRDDLDPFDNESVVRAVRGCPVPVVTGLGHQIDSTLTDLAADLAAPTPSGAAERIFPDSKELLSVISASRRVMDAFLRRRMRSLDQLLFDAQRRLIFGFITSRCNPISDSLDTASAQLKKNIGVRLNKSDARLKSAAAALQSASPLTILSKGYAICRDSDGAIIRDAAVMTTGQRVSLQMRDGLAQAHIDDVLLADSTGAKY